MTTIKFDDVYDALRVLMIRGTDGLTVVDDRPGAVTIEEHPPGSGEKPRWFGGVQIKKSYVSFHLMPVYVNPGLLDAISAELRARMQGKSCFNFKSLDEDLFAQLEELTVRCVEDLPSQTS